MIFFLSINTFTDHIILVWFRLEEYTNYEKKKKKCCIFLLSQILSKLCNYLFIYFRNVEWNVLKLCNSFDCVIVVLDALKDFNKEQKPNKEDPGKLDTPEPTTDKSTTENLEDAWTTDFIKQAAEQFEENLQNFIQNGNDL